MIAHPVHRDAYHLHDQRILSPSISVVPIDFCAFPLDFRKSTTSIPPAFVHQGMLVYPLALSSALMAALFFMLPTLLVAGSMMPSHT